MAAGGATPRCPPPSPSPGGSQHSLGSKFKAAPAPRQPATTESARALGRCSDELVQGPGSVQPEVWPRCCRRRPRSLAHLCPAPAWRSDKPNLLAHLPAAALNARNVHSQSTRMATSSQHRELLSDCGPPSLGYTQGTGNSQVPQSKYAELLAIIEELGKEIRPTYAGSKSAMERLKRGIIHARSLVRECLAETERNARS